VRRFIRWLLRTLTRSRGEIGERASLQEQGSLRWPPSMRGVKATWTPQGYVLHRIKPDGTSEAVKNNQHHEARLGMTGYGGTPPGVGY
jgi:hypothetical protein